MIKMKCQQVMQSNGKVFIYNGNVLIYNGNVLSVWIGED
jgi:hypothetical protein